MIYKTLEAHLPKTTERYLQRRAQQVFQDTDFRSIADNAGPRRCQAYNESENSNVGHVVLQSNLIM